MASGLIHMNDVAEARTDHDLVRASLEGDRAAFDALVVRHQRQVYALCRRFAATHEDASELAQDAFVRAYRALASFHADAAFTTWLYRIAVNVCLNHVARKRPHMAPLAEAERRPAAGEPADAAILRRERADRVRAAIAALPAKQRATLILRAYHDLPHEEIARVLGGTTGAAKTNLHHALRRLRALLTGDL